MPRYFVEGGFPNGLQIPVADRGAQTYVGVVDCNAGLNAIWLHSFVSDDK